MSDQHAKPEQDSNLLEELGYETQDVDATRAPRLMTVFILSTLATFAVAGVFMYLVAPGLVGVPDQAESLRPRTPEPPNPLLQGNLTAKGDMVNLRRQEKEKTETVGWVDKEAGIVHIPVTEAMDRVLEQGLPARPNARIPVDYDPTSEERP